MDENRNKPNKYKLAPIDVNIPTILSCRLTSRASNKPEIIENEDKSIIVGYARGRPSIQTEKTLFYLMSKAPRKKNGEIDIEKLRSKGIVFKYSEICDFLQIKNETRNRRTIKEELLRLGYITIYLHKNFIVNKGNSKANYSTVIQKQPYHVNLYDSEKLNSEQPELLAWQNQIKFDDILLDNLQNNVFRLYDIDEIRKIKSPTALKIYFIICLHNQSPNWKIGLIKLARQVPLETRIKRNTKLRVKLACDELKELNLIKAYRLYNNDENDQIIDFTFNKKNYEHAKNLFLSGSKRFVDK